METPTLFVYHAHALHLNACEHAISKDVIWLVFNQAIILHNVSCPSADENDYKI